MMLTSYSTILLFMMLIANSLQAQSCYFGGDVGTSHSDHGIGLYGGIKGEYLRAELGYGLISKRNRLGQPWSLAIALDLPDFYLKLGATDYRGSGYRRMLFEDGRDYNLASRWQLLYARFGAGIIKPLRSGFKLGLEMGAAQAVGGHVSYQGHADQTNLPKPKGIVVDDFFVRTPFYAGPGEAGLFYLRVFIQFHGGA